MTLLTTCFFSKGHPICTVHPILVFFCVSVAGYQQAGGDSYLKILGITQTSGMFSLEIFGMASIVAFLRQLQLHCRSERFRDAKGYEILDAHGHAISSDYYTHHSRWVTECSYHLPMLLDGP
jgi:hypothetical protein